MPCPSGHGSGREVRPSARSRRGAARRTVDGVPAPLLTATATVTCSFGMAPSTLNVLPASQVLVEGKPVATISDSAAMVNLPPFGMCTSLANPAVASATTAAQGVLTPQPCTPVPSPWTPGVPLVTAGGKPVANATCTCTCSFGGAITITVPVAGQTLG
jgi:hypothetical protein